VIITRSPVADAKSIKNTVEIEGFRQCHIRDGAALVCLLIHVHSGWLFLNLVKGSLFRLVGRAAEEWCYP
jgi:Xaa-Pro aminopeptidase